MPKKSDTKSKAKTKKTQNEGADNKKRHWAFVGYPESLPENWLQLLQETGLPVAVSPLHDKDIDEGGNSGVLKKPHYHVILTYKGPTSYNVVKKLTDSLGQPAPKPLEAIKGYYRYLTHMDNPEKAQYDEKDIKTLNGFNIADYAPLSAMEKGENIKRVHRIILEREIYEYSDLMDLLLNEGFSMDLYLTATQNTLLFNGYIRSRHHKRKEGTPDPKPKAEQQAEPAAVPTESDESTWTLLISESGEKTFVNLETGETVQLG